MPKVRELNKAEMAGLRTELVNTSRRLRDLADKLDPSMSQHGTDANRLDSLAAGLERFACELEVRLRS